MSILLTTPQTFSRGHGLSDVSFPEVKIVMVTQEVVAKRLVLHMQYGATVAGEWVGSPDTPMAQELIANFEGTADGEGGWIDEPDPAYDLFMLSQFAQSTSTYLYDENARALYQYLLDDGRYVGSTT